jgi:glycosyltransferase involved in cell wall biosynthesis
MRITFVGPVAPLSGGISHHSTRLVKALRDKGHQVRVLSWHSQYPKSLYRSRQVDPDQVPLSGTDFDLKWWSVASWWRARRIATQSDLLVFPYVTPFLAVPQWCISGGAQRVVAIVHNAVPHEKMPMQGPLARLALRNAGLLITHGRVTVEDLRTLGVTGRAEVVPMPPTLDISPSPLPRRPPLRLLFLGYVRPYKGLAVAISAMRLLHDRDTEGVLTVMGEFWDPVESYRQQVSELGLEQSVSLLPGYASDNEVRDALAQHHVVLAPYLEDTLSGVVPMAFAAGRPVISTTVRGVSEQVDDGFNGVLVDPGDSGALVDGIELVSSRLDELAAGARAASPSWERVAEAITSSFESLRLANDEA